MGNQANAYVKNLEARLAQAERALAAADEMADAAETRLEAQEPTDLSFRSDDDAYREAGRRLWEALAAYRTERKEAQ